MIAGRTRDVKRSYAKSKRPILKRSAFFYVVKLLNAAGVSLFLIFPGEEQRINN